MKILLSLTSLLFFSCLCASAQDAKIATVVKATTLSGTIAAGNNRPDTSYMPNAMQVQPPAEKRIGNNGNGLDIYQSQIDGMGVVKPDNTFASNMPVAGGKQIYKDNGPYRKAITVPGTTLPSKVAPNEKTEWLDELRQNPEKKRKDVLPQPDNSVLPNLLQPDKPAGTFLLKPASPK